MMQARMMMSSCTYPITSAVNMKATQAVQKTVSNVMSKPQPQASVTPVITQPAEPIQPTKTSDTSVEKPKEQPKNTQTATDIDETKVQKGQPQVQPSISKVEQPPKDNTNVPSIKPAVDNSNKVVNPQNEAAPQNGTLQTQGNKSNPIVQPANKK